MTGFQLALIFLLDHLVSNLFFLHGFQFESSLFLTFSLSLIRPLVVCASSYAIELENTFQEVVIYLVLWYEPMVSQMRFDF